MVERFTFNEWFPVRFRAVAFKNMINSVQMDFSVLLRSDGWSGCAKVAEFYDMLGQLRESVPVINNTCTVPAVVTGGILWGIRIVGAKGNYRITTNKLEVMQS